MPFHSLVSSLARQCRHSLRCSRALARTWTLRFELWISHWLWPVAKQTATLRRSMGVEKCAEFLRIASLELGVHEVPGAKDSPRIKEYHAATRGAAGNDDVAWCSSFANWVVKQAGVTGTGSKAARSWLKWGVKVDEPVPGCITVLWRDRVDSVKGHVAFYVSDNGDGTVSLMGGNQSNAVCVRSYDERRVLAYVVPK